MPNLSKTPPVGGKKDNQWYGARKAERIIEKVEISANSPFAALGQNLPPGARVVWATINNADAMTLDILGADTTVAHGRGAVALVALAPTALATGATTSHLLLGVAQTATAAAVPANSKSRGLDSGAAASVIRNANTTPASLYLVPYASVTAAGATQRFDVNTTAATSGYTLGAAAVEVDVQVFYETFEDTEDKS